MAETVTDLTKGVYRRLYSGFTKGQRINKLSLQAEAWFWRILATVDDFGNGDADPELCRAATVGRRHSVTSKQISSWLREMKQAGLITFYTAKGEPFLHVVGFEESQPAGKNGRRIRRFEHPGESEGIQENPDVVSASYSYSDTDTDTEDDNDTEHPRTARSDGRGKRLPGDFCLNPETREWAALNAPLVDLETALAEFGDYWRGVPGTKGRKLDWVATFRNRLRELQGRAASRNGGRGSGVNGGLAAAERVRAKYENRS